MAFGGPAQRPGRPGRGFWPTASGEARKAVRWKQRNGHKVLQVRARAAAAAASNEIGHLRWMPPLWSDERVKRLLPRLLFGTVLFFGCPLATLFGTRGYLGDTQAAIAATLVLNVGMIICSLYACSWGSSSDADGEVSTTLPKKKA
eukprot:COSAG01_NODE_6627_length_3571_cov_2.801843_1_plen_146_part_10